MVALRTISAIRSRTKITFSRQGQRYEDLITEDQLILSQYRNSKANHIKCLHGQVYKRKQPYNLCRLNFPSAKAYAFCSLNRYRDTNEAAILASPM